MECIVVRNYAQATEKRNYFLLRKAFPVWRLIRQPYVASHSLPVLSESAFLTTRLPSISGNPLSSCCCFSGCLGKSQGEVRARIRGEREGHSGEECTGSLVTFSTAPIPVPFGSS